MKLHAEHRPDCTPNTCAVDLPEGGTFWCPSEYASQLEFIEMPVGRIIADLGLEERATVMRWMLAEWGYANAKFGLLEDCDQRHGHDESMRRHGFTSELSEAFWFRQVTQYFKRAELMGVDSLPGRQALMKSLMTLFDACSSMIRVHGLPPEPGHPSGEVHLWVT